MSTTGYSVVLTTTGTRELAERIARDLVERRLAACVQLSEIRSVYRWDGEVHDEAETRLAIKCRTEDLGAIGARVTDLHDYDVPEIVLIPIDGGSEAYLAWLGAETLR